MKDYSSVIGLHLKKNWIIYILLTVQVLAGVIYFGHYQSKQDEVSVIRQQIESQEAEIAEKRDRLTELDNENKELKEKIENLRQEVSRRAERTINVEVTAYDLSVQSCGKAPGTKGYGITASGMNLAGHSWQSARAIAVDPRVIPLGSKVRLRFKNESMKKYNGIYTAVDTGGAIGGNRIDLFMGEGSYHECMQFGRQAATAEIL